MEYRILGDSTLNIPAVSFGAWAMGGWLCGGAGDAMAIRAIQYGIEEHLNNLGALALA